MPDTFLLDLDGTLLPMDMDKFVQIYFREMGAHFKDLIEPEQLTKSIWAATHTMVKNIEYRSNCDVFMEKFGQLVEGDFNHYQQRFEEYYDRGFLKTRESVIDVPQIRNSVAVLKAKGYNLVLATNPLFPEKAIYHRIRWAGFHPEDFSYISTYEKNHFCKPQLQYYEEVLQEIGKKPDQCIMVGNDVQEDIVAGGLGMETYLITDYMIHRTSEPIQSTYQGNYEEFYRFAQAIAPASPKTVTAGL